MTDRFPPGHATLAQADALHNALGRIAPAWPLDSQLASSPYWGLQQHSFADAAGLLQQLAASPLHMPLAHYRSQLQQGELTLAHLQAALDDYGVATSASAWLASQHDAPAAAPLPLQSALRGDGAGHHGLQDWRSVIVQQVSQFCAAWFDRHQAEWQPDRQRCLYQAWRDDMALQPVPTPDNTLATRIRRDIGALPADADSMVALALAQLQPGSTWLADWLHALLLRNGGWAAWCRYLGWQQQLQGGDERSLHGLLAIQLAWECLLDDGQRHAGTVWQRWQQQWDSAFAAPATLPAGLIWQRAAEHATHRPLLQQLATASRQPATAPAAKPGRVHAVFCIDVRSEDMRRALEQQLPGCSSSGFAGFFGLPLAIHGGDAAGQARLPGLLAPQWDATLPAAPARLDSWQHFERAPLSSFTLVESTGLAKLGKLLRKSWPRRAAARLSQLDPWLARDADAARLAAAPDLDTVCQQLLRLLPAMGLGEPLPDTVLLVGHASHSSNNPHASSLQCGACGGHGGHLHVLLLAGWLNRDDVRQQLAAHGYAIPPLTVFLPALHLTHSDELQLLPLADPAPLLAERASALAPLLAAAGGSARRERARQQGEAIPAHDPLPLLRERGHHWAETRPEWGLANNAFFIAAPRALTRQLDLGGRAFLQEYHWQQDPDGDTLAGILAGPLVVAHWINMQYFAAVADPLRFGSGNKVLHNVVGGRIGVFEGNSGDLRIGLSQQSVHDGIRWRHQALRLAACIAAPAGHIDGVLARQPQLARLVAGGWLHLYAVHDGQLQRKHGDGWQHD